MVDMILSKGRRVATPIPLDQSNKVQVKTAPNGVEYTLVMLEATRQEKEVAKRMNRREPVHKCWVRSGLLETRKKSAYAA